MSLDHLLGTWDVTMRHVAMPDPVLGRQTYERVLDGAFVMLRATYDHPDVPDGLVLLSEDEYHYFDVRGVTRVFELETSDSGGTMVRRDADFWQRASWSVVGPDELEGTGENSHDQGTTWEPDFTMTYTRRSA